MKEILIEELKSLQLDILIKVHGFCIENNLRYTLAYGTLLGAIRHKGYIPWDDDIDICMPRPDYEKFLRSFNGKYDNLYVIAPELNPDYYAPYANVVDNRTLLLERYNRHRVDIGVKIDVFPLDGVSNVEEYKETRKLMKYYQRILSAKRHTLSKDGRFVTNIKLYLRKLQYCGFNYADIQRKIIARVTKNDFNKSPLADCLAYQTREILVPRSIYDEYIDIEFEGHIFKAVSDYDLPLRKDYGDYMKVPPIDQQLPHHGFTSYWLS